MRIFIEELAWPVLKYLAFMLIGTFGIPLFAMALRALL